MHCESRPQSLIGEYFIDCQPGTAQQRAARRATIPVEQHVVDDRARPRQRHPAPPLPRAPRASSLNELGAGVARHAARTSTTRSAAPARRCARPTGCSAILAEQNQVLARPRRQRRHGRRRARRQPQATSRAGSARRATPRGLGRAPRRHRRAASQRCRASSSSCAPTMAALGARRRRAGARRCANLARQRRPARAPLQRPRARSPTPRGPAFRALGRGVGDRPTGAVARRAPDVAAARRVRPGHARARQEPRRSSSSTSTTAAAPSRRTRARPAARATPASRRCCSYVFDQSHVDQHLRLATATYLKVARVRQRRARTTNRRQEGRRTGPASDCAAALGPNQPGITTPDPTSPAARGADASAERAGAPAHRRRRRPRGGAANAPARRRRPRQPAAGRRDRPSRPKVALPDAEPTRCSTSRRTALPKVGVRPTGGRTARPRGQRRPRPSSSTTCWAHEAPPPAPSSPTRCSSARSRRWSSSSRSSSPTTPTTGCRSCRPASCNVQIANGAEPRARATRCAPAASASAWWTDMKPVRLPNGTHRRRAAPEARQEDRRDPGRLDGRRSARARRSASSTSSSRRARRAGRSADGGHAARSSQTTVPVELDEFYNMFDDQDAARFAGQPRGLRQRVRGPRRATSTASSSGCRRCSATCEPVMANLADPQHRPQELLQASSATPRASWRRSSKINAHLFTDDGRHVRGVLARSRGAEGHDRQAAADARRRHRVAARAAPVPGAHRRVLPRPERRRQRAARRAAAAQPRARGRHAGDAPLGRAQHGPPGRDGRAAQALRGARRRTARCAA